MTRPAYTSNTHTYAPSHCGYTIPTVLTTVPTGPHHPGCVPDHYTEAKKSRTILGL